MRKTRHSRVPLYLGTASPEHDTDSLWKPPVCPLGEYFLLHLFKLTVATVSTCVNCSILGLTKYIMMLFSRSKKIFMKYSGSGIVL